MIRSDQSRPGPSTLHPPPNSQLIRKCSKYPSKLANSLEWYGNDQEQLKQPLPLHLPPSFQRIKRSSKFPRNSSRIETPRCPSSLGLVSHTKFLSLLRREGIPLLIILDPVNSSDPTDLEVSSFPIRITSVQ